jgi:3-oxoacyl-[acyl-carrier-protein] synthase II
MKKRIVITGIGVVSPIGIGHNAFWDSSMKGNSGIGMLSKMETKGFPTQLGAEVKSFSPESMIKRNKINCMDICSQYATAAANLALKDASFRNASRAIKNAGVVVGTTLGPISFILDQEALLKSENMYRKIHKFTGYMALCNSLSSDISLEVGARGFSETISSACISGLSALERGASAIRNQGYDVMIVGGADSAFRPLPYAGMNIINILTNTKLRPFDKRADGTVLGEGAAFFVIEKLSHARRRRAKIYCEILETNFACESYNHFGHEKEPVQSARVLEEATRRSGVCKRGIDFVVTHGIGIKGSDVHEYRGYNRCFGSKFCKEKLFTSIKPYVGHPLAAASAMQLAYAALMLKNKIILPTLNFEQTDDSVCLNIVRQIRSCETIKHALVYAHAFGGKCGACLLKSAK